MQMEVKPFWLTDLKNLPQVFNKNNHCTPPERIVVDALQQIYGYMTFNNNKYGVLSNWERAWFFRRVEIDSRKTLEYACIELEGTNNSPSMLKALVGMVILSEHDWFYVSPTLSISPPARFFGDSRTAQKAQKRAIDVVKHYNVAPTKGTYTCLDLDFWLCDFVLSTARPSGFGCVVHSHCYENPWTNPLYLSYAKLLTLFGMPA